METLHQARLDQIQSQINALFIPEKPPERVLKAISALAAEAFSEKEWKKIQLPSLLATPLYDARGRVKRECRKFYVERQGERLEVIIPLNPIHRNPAEKTGMFGYKILLQSSEAVVEPRFVLTIPLRDEKTRARVGQELNLRHFCNTLPHFPHLEKHGEIEGYCTNPNTGAKEPCKKMVLVDECYHITLSHIPKEYLSSPSLILPFMLHIMEALTKLHEGGFVHCDLKKENILLRLPLEIALTDLGLAIPVGRSSGFRGTPVDAAPEVMEWWIKDCTGYVQPSLDLWTFGVITYEMLHGIVDLEQWPEFKLAQGRLGSVLYQPFKYTEKEAAFQALFPTRVQLEMKQFDRLGLPYDIPNFCKHLYMQWGEELKKFEAQVIREHPDLPWLQGILKVNSKQRFNSQEALEGLKKTCAQFSAPQPSGVAPAFPIPTHPSHEEISRIIERTYLDIMEEQMSFIKMANPPSILVPKDQQQQGSSCSLL